MVFQATLAGGQLVSSNVVSFDPTSSSQVVLTKLKAGALSAADIPANVAVSSMSHSPSARCTISFTACTGRC